MQGEKERSGGRSKNNARVELSGWLNALIGRFQEMAKYLIDEQGIADMEKQVDQVKGQGIVPETSQQQRPDREDHGHVHARQRMGPNVRQIEDMRVGKDVADIIPIKKAMPKNRPVYDKWREYKNGDGDFPKPTSVSPVSLFRWFCHLKEEDGVFCVSSTAS